MFSSGCCGRPRVLKRHSTRHRFEVLSRKKLIKRISPKNLFVTTSLRHHGFV